MGKTKSKECADKNGTDNLSAQVAVDDIDILRRLAKNEGPIAVSAYIDNSLNRWKKGTNNVHRGTNNGIETIYISSLNNIHGITFNVFTEKST